ncbi:HD domain-containing protein [bacterium]|nr:HD domain-containing protein [bacterium]
MRITSVKKLKPGDVLGKSLFNDRAELLLASGYELHEEMIDRLHQQGFTYVYIMDELSDDIRPETVISDTIRQIADKKLAETFEEIKNNLSFETFAPDNIKKRLSDGEKVQGLNILPKVRKIVSDVINEIVTNNVTLFTALPTRSGSAEEHQHALDVTLLSLLISQEFRYDQREMKHLGNAALLHDLGKMIFPQMKDKTHKELSSEQRMILREHPTYSMLILRSDDPTAFREHNTVLHHHERQDGTGFPLGLKGTGQSPIPNMRHEPGNIYRYAEILGVANHYDNLITGKYDGTKYTASEAISAIIRDAGKAWNPYVTKALAKVVQVYPNGVSVRVTGNSSGNYIGYHGIVAQSNPDDPTKPILILTHNSTGAPVQPQRIDFSNERYMNLELNVS